MRPYIIHLTDNLIGKHRFDDAFKRIGPGSEFLKHVQSGLEFTDVKDMRPETLGRIICSFEVGDVLAAKADLAQEIHFGGDCEEMFRELVALCLAYAIHRRFDSAKDLSVPYYRRTAKN